MEKQITIIIPTYNMERYIGKCLDSLLIPELDQVEVLVVNDGSKDRSSEIAHNYADKYPDSIRVIDKGNGNYGSCINTALPQVQGRYVKILDADDTFDPEAFSRFLKLLPEIDDDAVLTSFSEVDPSGNIIRKNDYREFAIKFGVSYDFADARTHVLKPYTEMHRICYKSDIFRRFKYEQAEGISYTDNEWAIIPMSYCNTVSVYDICIYRYLIGREGQTVSPEQQKKSLGNFMVLLDHFVDQYNIMPEDHAGRQYVTVQLYNFHQVVYKKFIAFWNHDTAGLLRRYDISLADKCKGIYDAIGEILYTPEIDYRIFHDLRKRNYPVNFTIPFHVKTRLSIMAKFGKIRRMMTRKP